MLMFLIFASYVLSCRESYTDYFLWRDNTTDFFAILPSPDNACETVSVEQLQEEFALRGRVVDYITRYDKNIRGNLAAANATWYDQLGELCSGTAASERRQVYGEHYTRALILINYCAEPGSASVIAFSVAVLILYVVLGVLFMRCVQSMTREG
jgi:hypothetical protein